MIFLNVEYQSKEIVVRLLACSTSQFEVLVKDSFNIYSKHLVMSHNTNY